MRAVDTNVLVRLIARDDERQTLAAAAFVEQGVWVSTVALTEAIWVLSSTYGKTPAELAGVIDLVLNLESVTLEDPDAISAALHQFRLHPKLGFTDCLILALSRRAGHLPLGTFDRALAKLPGCEKI
jgi:predicted nucleic-acid-binding protein